MDGVYYKLKDGVVLRGWDKLPFAVVDYNSHQVLFSGKEKMQAALACNGHYDFSSILVPGVFHEYAKELVRRGLAEPCEKGDGITEEQKYRKYNSPFISEIHWEMTGRCNMNCRHCFMSAPQNCLPQLSTAATLKIVEELADCGVMSVSLSGGEPLMRTDLPQVIRALSEKRIAISQFYSNGFLIDETLIDTLEQYGQKPLLVISFDGVDGWHDWMRGIPGSAEKAERAIRLWTSRGLRVWVQSVVHKGNKDLIRDTVNYLSGFHIEKVRFLPIDDEGEWLLHSDGMRITIEEFYEAVLAYLPCYYEDGMPLHVIFGKCIELDPEKPDEYTLVALKDKNIFNPKGPLLSCRKGQLEINPEGKVLFCHKLGDDYLEMPPLAGDDPNAKTASLSAILGEGSVYRRTMALTVRDFLEKGEECRECRYLMDCLGGCRANALQSGSLFGKDPSMCRFLQSGVLDRFVETMKTIRPTARPKAASKENQP